MTLTAETVRHSVRKDELELQGRFRMFFRGTGLSLVRRLPYELPEYWSPGRDVALFSAYVYDGLWANTINIATTRLLTMGYTLDNDVPGRVKRASEMLNHDWPLIAQPLAQDYCTTDNGGFLEIVRATSSAGSKVLGLVHLSSFRCWRTGDPERPVIYVDRLGKLHELKSWQVAEFSDMPNEIVYGVGLSATSRAYDAIYEHMAVREYFKGKATGRRVLSVHLVGGVRPKTIEDMMADMRADADEVSLRSYMGAGVYGEIGGEKGLSHIEIPFASLPDWFDQQKHLADTQVQYATAAGIDPTELDPRLIGNRALGAGSQAQVLDEKQGSKGLVSLRQQLMYFLNDTQRWNVLPGKTTFSWVEKDVRDQTAQAMLEKARADAAVARIGAGITTPEEEKQILVDKGDIPRDFIAIDTVGDETVTNEEKPTAVEPEPLALATPPALEAPAPNALKGIEPTFKRFYSARQRKWYFAMKKQGKIGSPKGKKGGGMQSSPPAPAKQEQKPAEKEPEKQLTKPSQISKEEEDAALEEWADTPVKMFPELEKSYLADAMNNELEDEDRLVMLGHANSLRAAQGLAPKKPEDIGLSVAKPGTLPKGVKQSELDAAKQKWEGLDAKNYKDTEQGFLKDMSADGLSVQQKYASLQAANELRILQGKEPLTPAKVGLPTKHPNVSDEQWNKALTSIWAKDPVDGEKKLVEEAKTNLAGYGKGDKAYLLDEINSARIAQGKEPLDMAGLEKIAAPPVKSGKLPKGATQEQYDKAMKDWGGLSPSGMAGYEQSFKYQLETAVKKGEDGEAKLSYTKSINDLRIAQGKEPYKYTELGLFDQKGNQVMSFKPPSKTQSTPSKPSISASTSMQSSPAVKVPSGSLYKTGDLEEMKERHNNAKRLGGPNNHHKASKAIDETFADQWKGITATEREAIESYTNGSYSKTNSVLRGKDKINETTRHRIAAMDAAFAKSKAPDDIYVTRNSSGSIFGDMKFGPGLVGKTIQDQGYVSTSAKTSWDWSGEYKFRTLIPKGAPAIGAGNKSAHPSEAEIILPRGSKFKIIAVDEATKTLDIVWDGADPIPLADFKARERINPEDVLAYANKYMWEGDNVEWLP